MPWFFDSIAKLVKAGVCKTPIIGSTPIRVSIKFYNYDNQRNKISNDMY